MNNIDMYPIPNYAQYMLKLMEIECSRQMCREFDEIIIKELIELAKSKNKLI